MAADRLPVFRAVGFAYRDVVRVLRDMPYLVAVVMGIVLAFDLMAVLIPLGVLGFPLVRFIVAAAHAFLTTPFLIAVHRYIILNVITHRYVIATHEPRFMRFFGWSLALSAVSIVVGLIYSLLWALGLPMLVAWAVNFAVAAALIFITVRLIILFPAIAVDAPGATPANAFDDTKGYFWDIFMIGLVASLPLIGLMGVMGASVFPPPASGATHLSLVMVAFLAVFELVALPLYVAIASRIFQALAERVLRAGPV